MRREKRKERGRREERGEKSVNVNDMYIYERISKIMAL